MNPSTYIAIMVMFIVLYILMQSERAVIAKEMIKKRKKGDNKEMLELAKRFIEKDCVIYSFNRQFIGVIKEVTNGAILLENDGQLEAINLDFVIRIREYPRKKNGKKKSVVLD